MDYAFLIRELHKNKTNFQTLLAGLEEQEYRWKPNADKWCLLEIVCHLYDEEREDFRARLKNVLESPDEPFTAIDPAGWVSSRLYTEQDFDGVLEKFLEERDQSVHWLQSLTNPKWDNAYTHPKFGPMSAKMFACNWLAHDYLHLRQILRLKFDYLQQRSEESLAYAGNW